MMEQAGQIATRRYWIGNNGFDCGTKFGILAGIHKFDFRQSLFPEDYVHVEAIVTFVSQHSLEVKIDVCAEDLSVHEQRLTNSATLWYVTAEVMEDRRVQIRQLPPLHYESFEDENEGHWRYQLQKDKRMDDYRLYIDYNTGRKRLNEDWNSNIDHKNFSKHTVQSSQMSLDRMIQASDCNSLGFSNASTIIELMDTTAVMAASKHCDNPCRTLSIDSINFHRPIRIDSLLTTVAKISTTSDHHLNVKIAAIAEELNTGQRHFVANASFKLISMDKNGNPIPVPPLLTFADLEQLRL